MFLFLFFGAQQFRGENISLRPLPFRLWNIKYQHEIFKNLTSWKCIGKYLNISENLVLKFKSFLSCLGASQEI
jgi:hypothetical protein